MSSDTSVWPDNLIKSDNPGVVPAEVAAQGLDFQDVSEEGFARIDTSDCFGTSWGSVVEYDSDKRYDVVGDIPVSSDELMIHVHGWRNSEEKGSERLDSMREVYEHAGYEEPVIGLTWGSDYSWWNAKELRIEVLKG